MIPLASWLEAHWCHEKGDGYGAVVAAAQKLDQEVWDRHRFKLHFCPDPWRFRDLSEREVAESRKGYWEVDQTDPPQLGMHADPTCRELNHANFYALIGAVTDRPLRVLTMNTAALYDYDNCQQYTLRGLFWTRRLWSDHPGRDCADLDVMPQNEGAPLFETRLPAVHLGTSWVNPMRRKQGIAGLVSRIHRVVALLKFGALPQFATIVPNRDHDKLFMGRDIGSVVEKRGGLSKETRVLFYTPAEILADAERLAGENP